MTISGTCARSRSASSVPTYYCARRTQMGVWPVLRAGASAADNHPEVRPKAAWSKKPKTGAAPSKSGKGGQLINPIGTNQNLNLLPLQRYTWTQERDWIVITVYVPRHTNPDHIKVVVDTTTITITLKGYGQILKREFEMNVDFKRPEPYHLANQNSEIKLKIWKEFDEQFKHQCWQNLFKGDAFLSYYTSNPDEVFSWTQTTEEMFVTVETPPDIEKEDIFVNLTPLRLHVGVNGMGTLVDEELTERIQVKDSTWTTEEGKIQIMLVKMNKRPWKKLFDKEIDLMPHAVIKQIVDEDDGPTKSYTELDVDGKKMVDLQREYMHAKATGQDNYALELEEELKTWQFRWGDEEE